MSTRAIALATLMCIPAAAALIASAPIAAADATACGGALPANVVKTAATAGDVRAACGPYIPSGSHTSRGSTSATNQG
jgi:hypothetical protein